MNTIIGLTAWQKKQAALLYYFSSMDYLKGLQDRLLDLRTLDESSVGKSRVEARDKLLRSAQWGDRNTTENWANNAWGFLADFQRSITRDIADRAFHTYHVTGANQCGRGMNEVSMLWATPAEQERFDAMFEELTWYAHNIDKTMDKTYHTSRWDDFDLTMQWRKQAHRFPVISKFVVRPDITGESGKVPPKTGVYISADDPYASLQFGWTGGGRGRLLDSSTFNELGKAALALVGRAKLWVDGKSMFNFVLANLDNPGLKSDPYFWTSQNQELAASLVAMNAFTSHPSQWYYVERVDGEFEPIETESEEPVRETSRFEAGEVCQKRGFYFTPARLDSRRSFEIGETFPDMASTYGRTIWQWDAKQG